MGCVSRVAGLVLTDVQREMVEKEVNQRWVVFEVRRRSPMWLIKRVGLEDLIQVGRAAIVRAAFTYDPIKYEGVPFGAYARRLIHTHITELIRKTIDRFNVSYELLVDKNGHTLADNLVDYRRTSTDPALHLWQSVDYKEQRSVLDWRSRIILYLRAVERYSFQDIAEVLSISRQRIKQIQSKAIKRLRLYREQKLHNLKNPEILEGLDE